MIGSMPFAEYLDVPGVNWSTLKAMRVSPLHYRHARDYSRPDTAALAVGRAVHTAVLEPDRFPLEYAVWTGGRKQGGDWTTFCGANAGRTIVNETEYATALAIRDAVRANKDAARLLKAGASEQAVTWEDSHTGLSCKARADWLSEYRIGTKKRRSLVDLKTTRDMDPRRFGYAAADYGYHCQLAHTLNGLAAHGWPADAPAYLIVVESAAPHDVAVLEVDENALWAGDETVMKLLRRVHECELAGTWPGRYAAGAKLELPGWAFPAYEETVIGEVA